MKLEELQQNWNRFGESDPMWGILAWPDKDQNRWKVEEFFETGIVEIEEVMQYLAGLDLTWHDGRALDFGCGIGRLSQALAHKFQRVDGVDISPTMLELAEDFNQYPDECFYHLNEHNDLQIFADETFDFIYSNITLQHMQPRYSTQYIAEFARIARPGGILVFQIPSRPHQSWRRWLQPLKSTRLWQAYRRIRYGDKPIMEMYGVPRSDVEQLLNANGAEIIDILSDTSADVAWHSYRYCARKR